MKNLFIGFAGILSLVFISCLVENPQKPVNKEGVFYSITIQNEHDVICVHEKDTIILSFENAYALSEETQILIKR